MLVGDGTICEVKQANDQRADTKHNKTLIHKREAFR